MIGPLEHCLVMRRRLVGSVPLTTVRVFSTYFVRHLAAATKRFTFPRVELDTPKPWTRRSIRVIPAETFVLMKLSSWTEWECWPLLPLPFPAQVRRILERNGLEVGDLDLVVFHQASKMALDTLARALAIPPERLFRNLSTIGNTVSASIPISLAQARADGRVPPGGLVLLSGFGVGLSWATALIRS